MPRKKLAVFLSLLFIVAVVKFGFYVSSLSEETQTLSKLLHQRLAHANQEVLSLERERAELARRLQEASDDPCGIYSRKFGSREYYVQIAGHRIPMPVLIKPESRKPLVGERVRVSWDPEGKALLVSIDPVWCAQK